MARPSVSAQVPAKTLRSNFRIAVEDMERLEVAAVLQRKKPSQLLAELIRTLPDPPAYPAQARKSAPSV